MNEVAELETMPQPKSHVAEIRDGHTLVKTFGFESAVCRGRTPLETAWSLASMFVRGSNSIHVRLLEAKQ
jgi:hypothetical protein